MHRTIFSISFIYLVVRSAPTEKNKRQVHTGVVPIFDGRSTLEPITFTYTTPPTDAPEYKSAYPVKIQKAANPDFPTLRPESTYVSFQPVLNAQKKENSGSAESSLSQGPFIGAPSSHNGRIYNQAQYFRVLQASISSSTPPTSIQDLIQKAPLNSAGPAPSTSSAGPKRPEIIPVSTGRTQSPSSVHGYSAPSMVIQSAPAPVTVDYTPIWRALLASWQQFKQGLIEAGAEKDWRNLWGKVSGVFEPFMGQVGEQVGRAMNTFMKHQQYKHKKMMQRIQKEVLAPYADELLAEDEEELKSKL